MARIRSIKPEFFSHEPLASTSAHSRLLAIGLLTLADSEGRLRWVPMQVHAQVFPWEASVNIQVLLGELIGIGYVTKYEYEDKSYLQIVNFSKHQRITGKEAEQKSRLPSEPISTNENAREIDMNNKNENGKHLGVSLGSIQMSREQGNRGTGEQGNKEQGNRGTGEQGNKEQDDSAALVCFEKTLIAFWNERMGQDCRMTSKRKATVKTRMADPYWMEKWHDAIERASQSDFCLGSQPNSWRADIEWFIKPDSVTKLLEGKYDNREGYHLTEAQKRLQNSERAGESFVEKMRNSPLLNLTIGSIT